MKVPSLRQSVKDDMDVVKSSPYLNSDLRVVGFVYDITHGDVIEVKTD